MEKDRSFLNATALSYFSYAVYLIFSYMTDVAKQLVSMESLQPDFNKVLFLISFPDPFQRSRRIKVKIKGKTGKKVA